MPGAASPIPYPDLSVPLNHLTARDAVLRLRGSKIREVANASLGTQRRARVLVRRARRADAGIHPPRRHCIAGGRRDVLHPQLRHRRAARGAGRLRVAACTARWRSRTSSSRAPGMSALMLATQALVGPGDRVVEVTPLWPNLVEIPKVLGAHVECLPLDFSPAGWTLDLDRLLSALTPGTRALYLNSPNNPTGLDHHPRGAASDPRALPPARHLDRRRRRLRPDVVRRRRRGACVPRHRGRARPPRHHQHVLEVVADDRLADRLAGGAAGARGPGRQADRVQRLVRAGIRSARGAGGGAGGRAGDTRAPWNATGARAIS